MRLRRSLVPHDIREPTHIHRKLDVSLRQRRATWSPRLVRLGVFLTITACRASNSDKGAGDPDGADTSPTETAPPTDSGTVTDTSDSGESLPVECDIEFISCSAWFDFSRAYCACGQAWFCQGLSWDYMQCNDYETTEPPVAYVFVKAGISCDCVNPDGTIRLDGECEPTD